MSRPHRRVADVRGGRADRSPAPRQRTRLSWDRTALAMLVCGLLLARHAAVAARPDGSVAVVAAGFTVLAAGATAALGRRADAARPGGHPPGRAGVFAVGAAVLLVGLAALALPATTLLAR